MLLVAHCIPSQLGLSCFGFLIPNQFLLMVKSIMRQLANILLNFPFLIILSLSLFSYTVFVLLCPILAWLVIERANHTHFSFLKTRESKSFPDERGENVEIEEKRKRKRERYIKT